MSNKTNLWIDVGIFAAFLVAFEPRLTGVSVHEWLSLAFAAVVVVHMLLHWKWIVAVLRRFFRRPLHVSRIKFVVDFLLFVAIVGVMLSGLLISRSVLPALGISIPEGNGWRGLHSLSANLSLVLVGLHFALNWNWVVWMISRYIVSPLRNGFTRRAPQPAPVEVPVEQE